MLTPADLKLPEKFPSWRPRQLETAAKVAGSQKYAFLLDAPTGSGKSLVAAAAQRILDYRVTYVCTTKQLQDQLLRDFPYARTLKGRGNYPCAKYYTMYPNISAEDCTHTEDRKCELRSKCQYLQAKSEALNAPLAILNTAYFLSEANYVGGFSNRELLVVDEFDTVEDQLMSFIEVVITQRQLSSLRVTPPQYKTKFESWVTWAQATLQVLRPRLRSLVREVEGDWSTVSFKALREIRNLKRLVGKLEFFVREVDKTWVWYPGEDRWVFKPVWVSKYASNALWKHTAKVFGMSATILDPRQVCANTGLILDDRKHDYLALPSPFPKENRPVYYNPCANIVLKQMAFALVRLTKAVTSIIEQHPNDKILLHTVSYKIRSHLMANIKNGRLVTHGIKDRTEVLAKFKRSAEPLVLVSPSMDRGVDLPDEECRVVIIAKVPYPDLGDIQVNRRMYGSKDGSNWYAHKAVSSVVQMAGRGVRSKDDYAITYILDEQFGRLYNDHKKMFPSWFAEAIVM